MEKRVYVTSDTHYGHTNIIKYCNRPFQNAEEMDEILIQNLNKNVAVDDVLYHLGDFCFGDYNAIINYRNRIKCKNIHLIVGNHDRMIWSKRFQLANIFNSIEEFKMIEVDSWPILLNHYPIQEDRKHTKKELFAHIMKYVCPRVCHGHTHKNEYENVGVDNNDFSPVFLGYSSF